MQTWARILYEGCWQAVFLRYPAGVAFCMLLCGTITGGFLAIVGLHPIAMVVASLPVLVMLLGIVCYTVGYVWEALAFRQQYPYRVQLPDFSPWSQYVVQGAHALAFYCLLLGFLGAMMDLFWPFFLLVAIACYPILWVPLVMATQDKTFLGLLDGCLDVPGAFRTGYLHRWMQLTTYSLVMAVLLPLVVVGLAFTVVGVFWIPSAILASCIYWIDLLDSLIPTTNPLSSPDTAWGQVGVHTPPPVLNQHQVATMVVVQPRVEHRKLS